MRLVGEKLESLPEAKNEDELNQVELHTGTNEEQDKSEASGPSLVINGYDVIIPIVDDKGVIEEHIVVGHKKKNSKELVTLYDSKSHLPSFLISFLDWFKGKPKTEMYTGLPSHNNSVELKTQSPLNGIACGYHAVQNTLNIVDILIDVDAHKKNLASNPVSKDSLLAKQNYSLIDIVNMAKTVLSTLEGNPRSPDITFAKHISDAWKETFLPNMPDESGFAEYFLGWPKTQSTLAKIAYVMLGGWIVSPVQNLIKLLTEFPLKCLAESVGYFKDLVLLLTPTSTLGKPAVTALLGFLQLAHGITEGARLLVRTVTSPVTSFKAALNFGADAKWTNTYPTLASLIRLGLTVTSAVCSIVGLGGLIIAAAPLGALIGAKLGVTATLSVVANVPALHITAIPVTWVLGQIGLTATPALIASAAIATLVSAAQTVTYSARKLAAVLGECLGIGARQQQYIGAAPQSGASASSSSQSASSASYHSFPSPQSSSPAIKGGSTLSLARCFNLCCSFADTHEENQSLLVEKPEDDFVVVQDQNNKKQWTNIELNTGASHSPSLSRRTSSTN
jgi:hypothetical protein